MKPIKKEDTMSKNKTIFTAIMSMDITPEVPEPKEVNELHARIKRIARLERALIDLEDVVWQEIEIIRAEMGSMDAPLPSELDSMKETESNWVNAWHDTVTAFERIDKAYDAITGDTTPDEEIKMILNGV